jgi:hypothetical protein
MDCHIVYQILYSLAGVSYFKHNIVVSRFVQQQLDNLKGFVLLVIDYYSLHMAIRPALGPSPPLLGLYVPAPNFYCKGDLIMHFLSAMLLSLPFLYILLKDKLKCQIILCRLEESDCQIIAPGRVGSAP